MKRLISIVTPCYNEELNIDLHWERVSKAIEPFRERYDFEHIYTDNASTDATFDKLFQLSEMHAHVRILRFSRNIGANRAIYQGLIHAKGDAAVLIQADLQDPPEMIPDFIRAWEAGSDVAYGQIQNRDEGFILKSLRKLYYRLVAQLADVRPPQNAGEFRITSRRVLDAIKMYTEDDIYLRGVIAHIGFKQKALPYERASRHKGKSSTNVPFLIGYAMNGIISTSVVPLRFVILTGILTTLAASGFAAYNIIYKILYPDSLPHGIPTLVILISFFAGIQIFSLGIIAEYIRKIYVQSLRRPQAFIQDRVNLP